MDTDWYMENLTFRDRARGENGYADCWGLCYLIYARELGIILPRHDDMSLDTAEVEQLAGYIEANANHFVKAGAPQEFDLLMLIQASYPTHIGCAIDDEHMIHLQAGCNVAIEPIFGERWGRRIYGIYRHEALLNGR